MVKTKPNRPSKAPKEPRPDFREDMARRLTEYQRELIARARDFYKDKNLGNGVSGEKYFNSLNDEQKIKAGELLQFRENNFDVLGFTKDGLGERSPLFGKRFSDEQFIKMFDRDKGFYGPGLREGDKGEDYMFRPGNEPVFDFFAEGQLGYVYRPDDPRIFDYLGFPKEAKTQHDQYDEKGRMKMQEGGRASMSNDKITQILKQMHEMSDEPVKKMQSGGRVYTPEQYATSYVDFFSPFSIQVDVPDPGDDTDDDDRDVNINIQEPVTGGDDAPDIFAGVNLKTGQSGVSYSKINATDYIKDFEAKEAEFKDLTDKAFDSGKGFSDYLSKQAQRTGLPVTGVVGLATGLPIAPLAAGMAKLNRQQHYSTANAIAAQGGGDILEVNNQTLSRKPGSKIVNGTLGNMTQEQAQRFVAIANGYIPGTYKDEERGGEEGGYVKTGHEALVHVDGNFAMDAFGNIHSAGGSQQETATQAKTAREILFEREMKANGYGAKLEELKRDGKFSKAAQEFKNTFNNTMKSGRPFFGTTAGMSSKAYADSLNSANSNIEKILENMYGASKVKDDTGGDSDDSGAGPITQTGFTGGFDSETVQGITSKTQTEYEEATGIGGGFGTDGFVSDPSFKDALIEGMEKSPGPDPSLGTVYDPTATVSLTTTTDASPPSDDSDDDDDDSGGGGGFTDSAGDSGISGSPEGEAGVDYDEDDFIDESGEFTEGFKEDDDDDDDGGGGGGGKIVCTAMNRAYGFGSFRQAIWLAHSRDMAPEYQAGYHAIFQPLVTYGYGGTTKPRKFVRNILEGIARRRTADIWMQKKGKRHPIGRIERAFWEPICYAVGRIVLWRKN